MHHFRVEHGGVVATPLINGDGERRILGNADHLEALRRARHTIAVAHPHRIALADFPQSLNNGDDLRISHIGAAEFSGVPTSTLPPSWTAMVCCP